MFSGFPGFSMFPPPPPSPNDVMLTEIKRTCSIFLNDAQYAAIGANPAIISVLFNHKDKLKKLAFHHNDSFDTLIKLSPMNIDSFFKSTTDFGISHDPKPVLHALYQSQTAATCAPVGAYCPPPVAQGYPVTVHTVMPSYGQGMHHHGHGVLPQGPGMHQHGHGMVPQGLGMHQHNPAMMFPQGPGMHQHNPAMFPRGPGMPPQGHDSMMPPHCKK